MALPLNPGVNISEIDQTATARNVSQTVGALAGQFRWGPLNKILLIENEDKLVRTFGKPNNDTAEFFFVASNFLSYGGALKAVRVTSESTARNATANGAGLLIKNDEDYELNYAAGQGSVGLWAAKHPGVLGNGLKVSICHRTGFSQSMTVSSTGTALTGTSFDTKLAIGSIVRAAGGEERKIVGIGGPTAATLDAAFTTNLSSEAVTVLWEFYQDFQSAPGTSAFASERGGVNDEVHIVVVDSLGQWTGRLNSTLERFAFVSLASDARTEENESNYYAEVLNQKSQYIRWMDHLAAGTNWGTSAVGKTFTQVDKPETLTMAGGVDGTAVSADLVRGYEQFVSRTEDISIILAAKATTSVAAFAIQSVAEVRKDCVVCISPEKADVVNAAGSEVANVIEFRNTLPSSSYAIMDCNWKKQLDRYNGVYRWVPLVGDIGGCIVRTISTREPWYAPAGDIRGAIKNVVQLAFNPSDAQIAELFANGVNAVVARPGKGVSLQGDKTLLSRPSAFDAINVRMLFIYIRKSLDGVASTFLFELNDEFTRSQMTGVVDGLLGNIKARNGVYDYFVKCDEENNTPEVIDRNELVCSVFIKPARSIRYIQINLVATRTGAAFSEVVGSV